MNRWNFKLRMAFSLIELMISLIIISLIVAAFVPVMTRKIKTKSTNDNKMYKEAILLFGNSKKDKLYDCKKVEENDEIYTECKFTVPYGVNEISAVMVGAGGGGAAGMQSVLEHKVARVTKTYHWEGIDITDDLINVNIDYIVAPGAAGGIYSDSTPKECTNDSFSKENNERYCPSYAVFSPAECNKSELFGELKDLCITARNIGDNANDEVFFGENKAAGVKRVNPNENCSIINNRFAKCCWGNGRDYTAFYDSQLEQPCGFVSGGDYSSCYRTTCSYAAAKALCEKYAPSGTSEGTWRLPSPSLAEVWMRKAGKALLMSSTGLQLCGSSFGAPYNYQSAFCPGAVNSWCALSNLWLSQSDDTTAYYLDDMQNIKSDGYNRAGSVRCVMDARSANWLYSSGGGASGSMLKNVKIPNSVIAANVGGQIVLQTTEGKKASEPNGGGISQLLVKDKFGNSVYGYIIYPGSSGDVVKTKAPGKKGVSQLCYVLNNRDESNCLEISEDSKNGNDGHDGISVENIDERVIAKGGAGGISVYNGCIDDPDEKDNNPDCKNSGFIPYGKGGNGGDACGRNAVGCKGAEDGAGGYVKVSYDIAHRAQGGNGGAGACAQKIERIKVIPNQVLTIKIGSGGIGGIITASGSKSGSDGGNTLISGLKPELNKGIEVYEVNGGFGGSIYNETQKLMDSSDLICNKATPADSGIVFKYQGKNGDKASIDDNNQNAVGGNGGLPGFAEVSGYAYTEGGCGGYFVGACINTKSNGLVASVYFPSKLYMTQDYGTLGSGGAGGGWFYDYQNIQPAGTGSKGLDGYVYLWWRG